MAPARRLQRLDSPAESQPQEPGEETGVMEGQRAGDGGSIPRQQGVMAAPGHMTAKTTTMATRTTATTSAKPGLLPVPPRVMGATEQKQGAAILIVDGGAYLQTEHHFRPGLLLEFANQLSKGLGAPIRHIHFFDAVEEPRYHRFPGMSVLNQKRRTFHLDLEKQSGVYGIKVSLHIRHLKPEAVQCPSPDCPHHAHAQAFHKPKQAGVDVDIAAFALTRVPKEVTHVYFWISDGDFAPVLSVLRGPRCRKAVRILNEDTASLSIALKGVVPEREVIRVSLNVGK